MVPLAHLLGDGELLAKAEKWIEWILASQHGDGGFGPRSNEDWWPRMVALKVLVQHADATGDERVVPFLARYFEYQLATLADRPLADWGAHRAMENVLAVLWLHRRAPDPRWPRLAELLLSQNADWVSYLQNDLITGRATLFDHLTHCVNVAMGLKMPAVRALLDGDYRRHYGDLRACLDSLDRWHGQVHGVFSGDEWLAGREAYQGIETCQVVEYLFTLEQSALVFGEGAIGDKAEEVAFNLLAACCDPQMLAHQYHQQANQVAASVAERSWTFSSDDANIFGLEPHFGCCLANLHQGWPKFAASLWMRPTEADGLAALCYAPCTVSTTVAGERVTVEEVTEYPFEETVRFSFTVTAPVDFELRLRVPGWCTSAQMRVNGEEAAVHPGSDGFTRLRRTWHTGDTVELVLPMAVRKVQRERNAVGVRLGPLVMVAPIAESWRPLPQARGLGEWEVLPLSSWNSGLHARDGAAMGEWPVERRPVPEAPFTADNPPVSVRAKGARVHAWQLEKASAGAPPDSPAVVSSPVQDLGLVPYGCARLRVAEFPTVIPLGAGPS